MSSTGGAHHYMNSMSTRRQKEFFVHCAAHSNYGMSIILLSMFGAAMNIKLGLL